MAKPITEEQVDALVNHLLKRVYDGNTYYLKEIAKVIKEIGHLKPSQSMQMMQIFKYGGKYEQILKKLQKYTSMNLDDLDKIFAEYAKKDQQFYEKFYKYRNVPFVPYENNYALKTQTEALKNMARNDMYSFTKTNVLGYTIEDLSGKKKFYSLRDTYNKVIDEAFLNVGQGKETFNSAMSRILKDLGTSGLKTLNYESGRSVRLDSAVRMHLKSRLRELHNENQKIFGKEFDYDGWEISVHGNPAPDHAEVQGRQFSIKEYEKLQNGQQAVDYKGQQFTLDHDGKNGYRPISEMNCYHFGFTIILGVSKPEYTDDELQQIINENEKGFEYNGKHYTNYQGTQLQRRIELAVRKQKDMQIMAKESDNEEMLYKSQKNINKLTAEYKKLCNASGLPTKVDRLRVSGYRRIKVEK